MSHQIQILLNGEQVFDSRCRTDAYIAIDSAKFFLECLRGMATIDHIDATRSAETLVAMLKSKEEEKEFETPAR
jgi:hypothetical protein